MGTDELDRVSGPTIRAGEVQQSRGLDRIASAKLKTEERTDTPTPQYQDGRRRGEEPEPEPKQKERPKGGFFGAAALLSIPNGMLSEPVRRMIDEMERLRHQLEQSVRRQKYLEEVADRDSNLPLLNRRAFTRELTRLLDHAVRANVPCALVHFYLETYDAIRRDYGLEAAEGALHHLAVMVEAAIRQSDIAGHVGGAGIAVILTMAEEEDAELKAWDFIQQVRSHPFIWEGQKLSLRLSVGIREFGEGLVGLTAEGVLRAADRDQHRKTVAMGE